MKAREGKSRVTQAVSYLSDPGLSRRGASWVEQPGSFSSCVAGNMCIWDGCLWVDAMVIKSLMSGTYNPKNKLSHTTGTASTVYVVAGYMGRLHTFKRWNWQKVKHQYLHCIFTIKDTLVIYGNSVVVNFWTLQCETEQHFQLRRLNKCLLHAPIPMKPRRLLHRGFFLCVVVVVAVIACMCV